MYPTVPAHIQQALEMQLPSLSHRSAAFQAIVRHTVSQLRELLEIPEDFEVFFHASATEIWERLLQNCVEKHSFHFVNGSFSGRFYQAARSLQLPASAMETPWGEGFAFEQAAIPPQTELINFTHNETSTGVMLPLQQVYRFRQSHPQALLTLDMVSSAPYARIDWRYLDAAYFSVQKCFGLPAGLGVLILNQRCLHQAAKLQAAGKSTGTYHSFQAQLEKARKHQTVETPNMLNIYLLGKVCEDMLRYGIARIRQETDAKAQRLYAYFDQHPDYSPFVKQQAWRSSTVVVVDTPQGSNALLQYLEAQHLVVGNGYGKMKGKQIRIANFPATSLTDIEGLLHAIELHQKTVHP